MIERVVFFAMQEAQRRCGEQRDDGAEQEPPLPCARQGDRVLRCDPHCRARDSAVYLQFNFNYDR
ncbi:MAG: hypothetical protein FJ144_25855 [Deltaproteobacteria bacterium]|nr:hypothetical protein [Deltaproteobacteria bacterium]